MRVFAVSDLHVDYEANARWVSSVSASDHQGDLLILAGDVSDSRAQLEVTLSGLARRFRKVLFVPGNHDAWVAREPRHVTSLDKLCALRPVLERCGVTMDPYRAADLVVVPLQAWYDFSFGAPGAQLRRIWADFVTCRWPPGWCEQDVTDHFLSCNQYRRQNPGDTILTFSHFLPRIDLMPSYIPADKQILYPVLGTQRLEEQLRALGSRLHVYGHSHVNRWVTVDGVDYVNNAFGYPHEERISRKCLLEVYDHS